MRKLNQTDFLKSFKIIGEVFGIDWLLNQIHGSNDANTVLHPVSRLWAYTFRVLCRYSLNNHPFNDKPVIELTEIADIIDSVRYLPHFDTEIYPRLKESVTFSKVMFEMFVASQWVKQGYEVHFIQRQADVRTPEMIAKLDGTEVFIECKSKDSYTLVQKYREDGDFWEKLDFGLADLLLDSESSVELFVFFPGEGDEKDILEIIKEVRYRLEKKYTGNWVGRRAGYLLRKIPSSDISDYSKRLFIPKSKNPITAIARVAVDENGQPYFNTPNRISCFTINAHSLSSVSHSFEDARGQIPSNGMGIIYINLDTVHLDNDEMSLYFELVSRSLATRFAPNQNTRIGAIVLTTEPRTSFNPRLHSKRRYRTRLTKIEYNPYRKLPDNLKIPL